MSLFVKYLKEKQNKKEKVKVYLKSQTGKDGSIKSKMLQGFIEDVDENTIQLSDEECIIERNDVVSIKPDRGGRDY